MIKVCSSASQEQALDRSHKDATEFQISEAGYSPPVTEKLYTLSDNKEGNEDV